MTRLRTRYVMCRSFESRSVDEGDRVNAEVGVVGVLAGLNAGPDDALEPAGDRARGAVRAHGGDVERDPSDDVVLRVRAGAAERVVDREQELGAEALLERALDRAVVPLRAGVGEVV